MDQIDITDFQKIEIKVGIILSAEAVNNSNKLLKFQVDLGEKKIQVVSGIAKWHKPDELVGVRALVVVNLKPAELMGEISEGMMLTAELEGDKGYSLITLDKDIQAGAGVY